MTRSPFSGQITFLRTIDLDRTSWFYGETLGLTLALDQGKCRIYHVSAGGYLGFCQADSVENRPDGVVVTLVTSGVDEWYRHLMNQGVSFERPPQVNPEYRIYHCVFRDPNGYLVEIQRFEDPFWPGGA